MKEDLGDLPGSTRDASASLPEPQDASPPSVTIPIAEPIRTKISGQSIDLHGGRSVFVGRQKGSDDTYIEFVNGDAKTRLRISPEARRALFALLDERPKPVKAWTYVFAEALGEWIAQGIDSPKDRDERSEGSTAQRQEPDPTIGRDAP